MFDKPWPAAPGLFALRIAPALAGLDPTESAMPKPILPPELAAELAPATLLVRGGSERTAYEETSEALFLTSGFVYSSAAEAEAAFKQDGSRYVYSRFRNPTVTMFEERFRLTRGGGGLPRDGDAAWRRCSRRCCARCAPVERVVASARAVRVVPLHRRPSCCRATGSRP